MTLIVDNNGGMNVDETTLHGGHPCLSFGQGTPLAVLPGLTATHTSPEGFDRRAQVGMLKRLSELFTVHWINRRPGLAVGTTMADLGGHYAEALQDRFAGPVMVMGVSTGGSTALQLAIDHPDLVSKLALVCAACRLSDRGRAIQAEFAELVEQGQGRRAWAKFGASMASSAITRRATAAMMWTFGGMMTLDDPSDLIRTIYAEDGFNATFELDRIKAPTIVVGGGRDVLYPPELLRITANGIAAAQLELIGKAGHMGASSSGPKLPAVMRFLSKGN